VFPFPNKQNCIDSSDIDPPTETKPCNFQDPTLAKNKNKNKNKNKIEQAHSQ